MFSAFYRANWLQSVEERGGLDLEPVWLVQPAPSRTLITPSVSELVVGYVNAMMELDSRRGCDNLRGCIFSTSAVYILRNAIRKLYIL